MLEPAGCGGRRGRVRSEDREVPLQPLEANPPVAFLQLPIAFKPLDRETKTFEERTPAIRFTVRAKHFYLGDQAASFIAQPCRGSTRKGVPTE